MARRTKEQIRIDREVSEACQKHSVGCQIPVLKLSEIRKAGEDAAKAGKSIDEAVIAALVPYRIANVP